MVVLKVLRKHVIDCFVPITLGKCGDLLSKNFLFHFFLNLINQPNEIFSKWHESITRKKLMVGLYF